jgi:hypothetical protein
MMLPLSLQEDIVTPGNQKPANTTELNLSRISFNDGQEPKNVNNSAPGNDEHNLSH